MAYLALASLTAESLQTLCQLTGHEVTDEPWRTLSTAELSEEDRRFVA